jgi:hypothetical protein
LRMASVVKTLLKSWGQKVRGLPRAIKTLKGAVRRDGDASSRVASALATVLE